MIDQHGDDACLVHAASWSIHVRDADAYAANSRLERSNRELHAPLRVRPERLRDVEMAPPHIDVHLTASSGLVWREVSAVFDTDGTAESRNAASVSILPAHV